VKPTVSPNLLFLYN